MSLTSHSCEIEKTSSLTGGFFSTHRRELKEFYTRQEIDMPKGVKIWYTRISCVFTAIVFATLVFGLLTNTYSVIGPITIDGR